MFLIASGVTNENTAIMCGRGDMSFTMVRWVRTYHEVADGAKEDVLQFSTKILARADGCSS